MNADIRIAVTFKGHRKRMKLRALLGPGSTDFLLDLWIAAAHERPDGKLTGLDVLDIALMAGYPGEPEVFVKALGPEGAGFLDFVDGTYSLHDWQEHNPFAAQSVERGDKARFSRLAATDPELHRKLREEGVTRISAAELAQARADLKDPPPKAPKGKKVVYAERVSMYPVEHAKLVEKYGEAFTAACIAKLSNYKEKTPGKNYKDDYKAILKWVVDSVTKTLAPRPSLATGAGRAGKTAAGVKDRNREAVLEFCDEGSG